MDIRPPPATIQTAPSLPKNAVLTLEECQPCRIAIDYYRPYDAKCGADFRKKGYTGLYYCTRMAEFRGPRGYWVCSRHRGIFNKDSPLARSQPTPLKPPRSVIDLFPKDLPEATYSSYPILTLSPPPQPPFLPPPPPNSLVSSPAPEDSNLNLESKEQEPQGIRTHLIFHDGDDGTLGWYLGELTENELSCLNHELKVYNAWIDLTDSGLAPPKSYMRPTYADRLHRCRKQHLYEAAGFDPVPKKDSKIYTYRNRYLQVICESKGGWPFHSTDHSFRRLTELDLIGDEDSDALDYDEQPLGSLLDFLCDPLDLEDDYSMGYAPLPFTARLIENWNQARSHAQSELSEEKTALPALNKQEGEFWQGLYG
jgi:hypothetical protein